MDESAKLSGPDLTKGVALSKVAARAVLLGHAYGEPAFHLGTTVASIDERLVTLQSGEHLPADVVVVGSAFGRCFRWRKGNRDLIIRAHQGRR